MSSTAAIPCLGGKNDTTSSVTFGDTFLAGEEGLKAPRSRMMTRNIYTTPPLCLPRRRGFAERTGEVSAKATVWLLP